MLPTASTSIPLVIATDEHYVIHLAALLKSIELTYKAKEIIDVYIIDDGVKQKSKLKIEASVSADVFHITWVKTTNIIPAGTVLPADKTSYPLTLRGSNFYLAEL